MNEQRTIEKILDNLDEVLENTWALPLSGGKRVVDIEDIRAFADEIRMNLPIEIRKARARNMRIRHFTTNCKEIINGRIIQ